MLNRTRKAFTMIELIVVIVILGILALIAIPTFQAVIERTRKSTLERAGESLGREAVALAAFDNGVVTVEHLEAADNDLKGDSATPDVASYSATGFTIADKHDNVATVTINGTVVTAEVAEVVEVPED